MAGEHAASLSDELERWLDREARKRGVDRGALLERAVAGYRLVDGADAPDDGGEPHEAIGERVGDLSRRVAAVEDDLDAKIEDLRSRVVQLKREADAKAPADHGHAELGSRAAAAERSEGAAADVESLEARVERGFENYEEVLGYLRDERDELDRKLTRLARTAVDLRDRTAELERGARVRNTLDELRAEAARGGVASADCGGCGGTVHLGLLGEPACPHCGAGVVGVEPARGFFDSARLLVGEPSALAGGASGGSDDA